MNIKQIITSVMDAIKGETQRDLIQSWGACKVLFLQVYDLVGTTAL